MVKKVNAKKQPIRKLPNLNSQNQRVIVGSHVVNIKVDSDKKPAPRKKRQPNRKPPSERGGASSYNFGQAMQPPVFIQYQPTPDNTPRPDAIRQPAIVPVGLNAQIQQEQHNAPRGERVNIRQDAIRQPEIVPVGLNAQIQQEHYITPEQLRHQRTFLIQHGARLDKNGVLKLPKYDETTPVKASRKSDTPEIYYQSSIDNYMPMDSHRESMKTPLIDASPSHDAKMRMQFENKNAVMKSTTKPTYDDTPPSSIFSRIKNPFVNTKRGTHVHIESTPDKKLSPAEAAAAKAEAANERKNVHYHPDV